MCAISLFNSLIILFARARQQTLGSNPEYEATDSCSNVLGNKAPSALHATSVFCNTSTTSISSQQQSDKRRRIQLACWILGLAESMISARSITITVAVLAELFGLSLTYLRMTRRHYNYESNTHTLSLTEVQTSSMINAHSRCQLSWAYSLNRWQYSHEWHSVLQPDHSLRNGHDLQCHDTYSLSESTNLTFES